MVAAQSMAPHAKWPGFKSQLGHSRSRVPFATHALSLTIYKGGTVRRLVTDGCVTSFSSVIW